MAHAGSGRRFSRPELSALGRWLRDAPDTRLDIRFALALVAERPSLLRLAYVLSSGPPASR